MTAPEPTAEQLSTAMQLITTNSTHGGEARIDFADAIARALAAAVHAEREKYLRVADTLQAESEEAESLMRDPGVGTYDSIRYETEASTGYDAARRIREVTG